MPEARAVSPLVLNYSYHFKYSMLYKNARVAVVCQK